MLENDQNSCFALNRGHTKSRIPSNAFECLRIPSNAFEFLRIPSNSLECLQMPSNKEHIGLLYLFCGAFKYKRSITEAFSALFEPELGHLLICLTCWRPSSPPHSSTATGEGDDQNQPTKPLHSHNLTDCVASSDLRAECEPSDDRSLAIFFRKVVARHMELEKELTGNSSLLNPKPPQQPHLCTPAGFLVSIINAWFSTLSQLYSRE